MLTYRDISVYVDGTKITDYISFIWTDRYCECGDFEMEVPYTANNERFYRVDQIVTCNLSRKKMIIETIKISISDENGKRMLLSGRSWESILDRRVVAMSQVYDNDFFNDNKFIRAFEQIFTVTFGSGNQAQVLTSTSSDPNSKEYKDAKIQNNKRSTAIKVAAGADPKGHISKANINIEATNKTVLELLQDYCSAKDFGFELIDNTCRIYDGYNRSLEFSLEKGNLSSADYSASKQNYKNVIYVQGEEYTATNGKYTVNGVTYYVEELEEGKALVLTPTEAGEYDEAIYYRAEVDLAGASGLNRREMAVESSKALGQNSNPKYIARLQSEGRVELLKNHRWEIQTSCEIVHDPNMIYMVDYYLGDLVNVSFDAIYNIMDKSGSGKAVKNIKMRVNEFTISHSESGLDLYPTLIEYDADKYQQSNDSDAGIDPTEELSGDNSWMKEFVRVNFWFNGGTISNASGVLYRPEDPNGKRDQYIKDAENPVWYLLPESFNSGEINTSQITGKFSFQQRGDAITIVDVEPTKEHYIFQGWYIGNVKVEEHVPGDDSTGYIIGRYGTQIDVYAKWEIEKYDITFNHGDGGRWSQSGANENDEIVYTLPYGAYPSPPRVIAQPGYILGNPAWNPELSPVEGTTTYTAQWTTQEEVSDSEVDPEDADYDNGEETEAVVPDEESSTEEQNNENKEQLGLIHFRSYASALGDAYGLETPSGSTIKRVVRSEQKDQAYEWVYTRDLKNGYTMQAHWFDPFGNPSTDNSTAAGLFRRKWSSNLAITIFKDKKVIGAWAWGLPGESKVGGYVQLPEVAFSTVPVYIPYFEYSTLLEGYNRGDIKIGAITGAPIFIPFKYFRKIRINNRDTYWLLCVPPLDWLTNWQNYYYFYKAGNYVGFTCQFYDDKGNLLNTTWTRDDSENSISFKADGTQYSMDTQCSYGIYYTPAPSYGYISNVGPNTIYSPQSQRYRTASSYGRSYGFDEAWLSMGWQWRKIPNDRWSAEEFYTASSFYDYINYSGPLVLNMDQEIQIQEASAEGQSWNGPPPHHITMGMIFGPGFKGYDSYHIWSGGWIGTATHYYWPLEDRTIAQNGGTGDMKILHKQYGQQTLGSRILQQINNVISKSNSLSYFTYKVWLPAVAKVKSTTWYVSSDGQNWHVISWAHGNSVKIKTTDKTVAENEATGLTGADAIVGTNNSYYKSEVKYTDEDGNEFMQTSDVGQLRIDDTDISGAGIEMDSLMNPDGTTNGLDIETEMDMSKITDSMNFDDLNPDQMMDIESMFKSGSTAKMISESTGIPESIVNIAIKAIQSKSG